VPRGSWGRTWLVVAVIVTALVVRYELFLRARGYHPSVKDDAYAWSWERMRVADDSQRTVALLGSSRIMLAFSGAAFEQTLPGWKYAQLGIDGSTPVAAFQDLAADPGFRGIAIVDMSEIGFLKASWASQAKHVETYHRRWREVGELAERWLATKVQSRLALTATRTMRLVGLWLRTGTWPRPPYLTTHADRTRFADYAIADVARLRKTRVDLIASWELTMRDPQIWLDEALALEPAIAAIEARGGRVVYVRMPTCDERWDAEEKITPKAQFWDVLATRTRAVTVHFKDYPQLAKLPCPDTSHIDSNDGPEFTRAFLEILRARGVFDRR